MGALSLRLPESLHRAAREEALNDGVSINQLVTTALAEKIAALKAGDYLAQQAKGADEADWDKVLSSVPDAEPEAHDRIPKKKVSRRKL